MTNPKEKNPQIGDSLSEKPKLTYSLEAYEEVLRLIASCQQRIKALGQTRQKYEKDLGEDQRIYGYTKSDFRKRKIETATRKIKRTETDLKRAETEVSKQKEKLRALESLAVEEARKEGDEYNARKLQTIYEQVTAIEERIEHFDPNNIPTAEEYARLQNEYDQKVSELIRQIANFLAEHPSDTKLQ